MLKDWRLMPDGVEGIGLSYKLDDGIGCCLVIPDDVEGIGLSYILDDGL